MPLMTTIAYVARPPVDMVGSLSNLANGSNPGRCSENGHAEVVKILIECGANIRAKDNYALR